jgi:hypothetical protein
MPKKLLNWKKEILTVFVVTLLLVIPLYPKFPFLPIPGSQVSVRLEDVLVFAMIAIWGIISIKEIPSYIKNPTTRAFLLFWFIGLVSLMSAVFVTKTVIPHIAFLHWFRRVQYMIMFFIGYSAIKEKVKLTFIIKCLLVVVPILFIYGIGQKYLGWPVITTQNPEYAKGIALRYVPGGHLVSTFAGHYDMASYMVFTLPLIVVLFVSKLPQINRLNLFSSSRLSRVFIALISTLGLWLLVNAAHRISIVSYMLSVSAALVFTKRKRFIPLAIVASIVFIGFSSNLIDRYTRIFQVTARSVLSAQIFIVQAAETNAVPQKRISSTPQPTEGPTVFEDRSVSIRLNMEWPRAFRAFMKNPLLGTGYSSITLATDNDYLRMLGETGILGVGSFLLICVRIVVTLFPIYFKKSLNLNRIFVLSVFGALAGVLLNMVFVDILEASKFAIHFWLILGLAVGLAEREYV